MNILKVSIAVTTAAIFALSCSQQANQPVTNPMKATNAATPAPSAIAAAKDEAAMAADLYTVNCMTCHKDSGKGGPVTVEGKKLDPDDLTAEKFKKMSDEKLIGYVRDGIVDEGMPSFKDKLKEPEMAAVIKHVRTLQSK